VCRLAVLIKTGETLHSFIQLNVRRKVFESVDALDKLEDDEEMFKNEVVIEVEKK